MSALRAELQTLRQESRRAEFLQARAALGRARAELDPLRETLPPDLVGDLEKAQEILDGMAERLRVPR